MGSGLVIYYPHSWYFRLFLSLLLFCLPVVISPSAGTGQPQDKPSGILRLATFDIDATPPVGSILAYDTMTNVWDMGLRARGIVLLGAGKPVVLCSIDWIGIANGSQDAFQQALAAAAGTIPERVAVHTVHQHDAPECDFTAEQILLDAGLDPRNFDGSFARELIRRLGDAVKKSLQHTQPFTHIGTGEARVYEVASNRRILGEDGLVRDTRYTTCPDSALRAEPEGLIDPMVSVISFWNDNKPLAVLSYYATHPQSYYRTGVANPDFPGIARFLRQLEVPDALHVHFTGAGGNLGAGKYNDGSHVNRGILAQRLADGMKRAWESTRLEPVSAAEVSWSVDPISLPPSGNLEKLQADLNPQDTLGLFKSAGQLAWLQRCQTGKSIAVTCLKIGHARILHLPGEAFVEFQLAAKAERPDLFVAVAAFGDYGPYYICTEKAYEEGGYEAGPASNVSPGAERILMKSIHKVLRD